VTVAAPDADAGSIPAANRRGVGPPRKQLPRKKVPADLRSLARGHTELCIRVLAGIVSQEAMPAAARVSAAGILLDRGWGKAPQDVKADGEIKITIRKLVDVLDAEEATVLDGESRSPSLLPKQ
jgi:hypothetical protein